MGTAALLSGFWAPSLSAAAFSAATFGGAVDLQDQLVESGGSRALYSADALTAHGELSVPEVGEGDTRDIYGPHHFDLAPPHAPFPHPTSGGGTHYFAETGDLHHFAWFSSTPTSPAPPAVITIKYDFRPQAGFPNLITPAQSARAVDAFSAWAAATNGRVAFVLDTVAPASSIINVGTGDLAALGSTSGPGGTLGLGGGSFFHSGATHSVTGGVAWQDSAETWDTTIGNGNPGGTFDYFTVVAQEIGHALGLGHTDNAGGPNMMNGSYAAERTALTAVDVSHMTSLYGVPEPSSMLLAIVGGLMSLVLREKHRKRNAH